MISGDQEQADAGAATGGHDLGGMLPGWVVDGHQADECQRLVCRLRTRARLPIGNRDNPVALGGERVGRLGCSLRLGSRRNEGQDRFRGALAHWSGSFRGRRGES